MGRSGSLRAWERNAGQRDYADFFDGSDLDDERSGDTVAFLGEGECDSARSSGSSDFFLVADGVSAACLSGDSSGFFVSGGGESERCGERFGDERRRETREVPLLDDDPAGDAERLGECARRVFLAGEAERDRDLERFEGAVSAAPFSFEGGDLEAERCRMACDESRLVEDLDCGAGRLGESVRLDFFFSGDADRDRDCDGWRERLGDSARRDFFFTGVGERDRSEYEMLALRLPLARLGEGGRSGVSERSRDRERLFRLYERRGERERDVERLADFFDLGGEHDKCRRLTGRLPPAPLSSELDS